MWLGVLKWASLCNVFTESLFLHLSFSWLLSQPLWYIHLESYHRSMWLAKPSGLVSLGKCFWVCILSVGWRCLRLEQMQCCHDSLHLVPRESCLTSFQSAALPCPYSPQQASPSLQAPRLLLPLFAKLLVQRLRKSGEGQDVPMGLPEAFQLDELWGDSREGGRAGLLPAARGENRVKKGS